MKIFFYAIIFTRLWVVSLWSNFTIPAVKANKVKSLPHPTFKPGFGDNFFANFTYAHKNFIMLSCTQKLVLTASFKDFWYYKYKSDSGLCEFKIYPEKKNGFAT